MELMQERTQSLCPVCFEVIDASVVERGGAIYLTKACPTHDPFEARNETDAAFYGSLAVAGASQGTAPPDNVMITVTRGCNMECPIC
ncbi:MAG: hypothetical protein HZB55_04475 [Deltaproteobacteria bacterium]|nr:hypothetical protein [Deltaproteobacteria bacterium]